MRLIHQILFTAGVAACLTVSPLAAAPMCTTDTAANYVANYGDQFSPCDIGGLEYKSFLFKDNTVGAHTHNSSSFTIVPDTGGGVGFSVLIPGGTYNNEVYWLSYLVDPAPILGGEELSMFGDDRSSFAAFSVFSPLSVGTALATKWACPQGLLGGVTNPLTSTTAVTCNALPPNSLLKLQVGLGEEDSGDFAEPVGFTNVIILFELNGELPDITVVSSPRLISENAVPEPGTYAMMGGGLALLGLLRRRKS